MVLSKGLKYLTFLIMVFAAIVFYRYLTPELGSKEFQITEFLESDNSQPKKDSNNPSKIKINSKLKIKSEYNIELELSESEFTINDNRESNFSKTYSLISEFTLSEPKAFKIKFTEKIQNIHSIIVVGTTGLTNLNNFQIQSGNQVIQATSLNNEFFENDTQRFEMKKGSATKLSFSAQPKENKTSSFKVFMQKFN